MNYSSFYVKLHDTFQRSFKAVIAVWNFVPAKIYLGFILLSQALLWFQALNILSLKHEGILIFHYNIDFGIDLVGNPRKIYLFPLAAALVAIFNFILSATFHRLKDATRLYHLLFSSALIFAVCDSLVLFAIYLVNFQ